MLDPGGGFFRLQPPRPFVSRRRYLPYTNILETRFETARGDARILDCMPIRDSYGTFADEELLRCVECTAGEIEFDVEFVPRPDFARQKVRLKRSPMGLRAQLGGKLLLLRSTHQLEIQGQGAVGRVRLRQGQRATFSLSWAEEAPALLPPVGLEAWAAIEHTARVWSDWVGVCSYDGPWKEAVIRSALVLKSLIYAPTGAIVAAPTTSLPERVGGDLNWDYRFCWLRDASFVARALLALGHRGDAEGFTDWMIHATRLTHPRLEVLYDVYGRRPAKERELTHFAGWKDSTPVRIGNGARNQLQLDVYGEVADAVARIAQGNQPFGRDAGRLIVGLGQAVCEYWTEPDESIWEVRSGATHHTFSKALCWAALDRIIDMSTRGLIRQAPIERFVSTRDEIRRTVDAQGFNSEIGSWTSVFGGDGVDASLLLLPHYGFIDHRDPRMLASWKRMKERLYAGPGLLRRYEYEDEGAFGICSFWAVQYLAGGGGTLDEARRQFEETLEYANDLGLFSEEMDPETGDALGNFPQAFSHVGLVNAAISIEHRTRTERGLGHTPFTAPCAHDDRFSRRPRTREGALW